MSLRRRSPRIGIRTTWIVVAMVATSARATADWQPTPGPIGGSVTAFVSQGDALFAGTNGGGVYRSLDSGTTWSRVRAGLPATFDVVDLAVAGGSVFMGSAQHGVFRSADAGNTWTPANGGLSDVEVLQLISRGDDLLLLHGDGFGTGSLFLSADLGASWTDISAPTPLTQVVAVGPAILGPSSFAIGIFRTDDDGLTWDLLPGDGLTTNILDEFAVDGPTVFGASIDTVPGSLFRTDNFGDHWTQIALPCAKVEGLGVGASALFLIGAQDNATGPIYRSTDGGASWQSVNMGLSTGAGRIVNRIGTHSGRVCAGTEKGVFRSDTLGDLWTESSEGLRATRLQTLESDAQTLFATVAHVERFSSFIFVVTTMLDTLFRSPDAGATWLQGGTGLPDDCDVKNVAQSGTVVYVGTVRHGVFKSGDGGSTWTAARTGLPIRPGETYYEIDHLAVSNSVLFVAIRPWTFHSSHGAGYTTGGGMYRSTNAGLTWELASTGLPVLRESNPPDVSEYYPYPTGLGIVDSTLFFATQYDGVWRSTDQGATWTDANAGLPILSGKYPRLTSFAGMGGEIYAGSRGFNEITTNGMGVFRSTDGGQNWAHVSGNLADYRPVESLAASCTELYAGVGCPTQPHDFWGCSGAPSDGVYRSRDGGVTWERLGAALDGLAIPALCLQGAVLYAGTTGAGVWGSSLRDCDGNGLPDDCEVAGDLNRDGVVDAGDFTTFAPCCTGPGPEPVLTDCDCSDLDADGDVDLGDFATLQLAIDGIRG